MQLFRGTAEAFAAEINRDTLIGLLERRFNETMLYPPAASEVRSWSNSLPEVARELHAAGLGKVEVLIEYSLPLTSKRVDVLIIGTHPEFKTPVAIVWENKQWTSGEIEDVDERIVSVLGRRLLHPQQQVFQYVEYLTDFNQLCHSGGLWVGGLIFLHNATGPDVNTLRSASLVDVAKYPMFTGDDLGALRKFLQSTISSDQASAAADTFLQARIRPSKQLLDHVEQQIQGNESFTLLDEQKVAYEVVRSAIDESRTSNTKKVVIVKGGPGSGKSVIATSLIGGLAKQGYNVSHATGSRSFTTTLRARVGKRASNLFRYFNNFALAPANDIDVLVADEAHRIRETSNSRFTKKDQRSSLPQVEELIQAARVPVFLLDENQVVRPGEIGTIDAIKEAANRSNADIIDIDLDGHFRCGGSEAYLSWVERLLGLADGGPVPWLSDGKFELRVAESITELEHYLERRQEDKYSSRMTAGFCWPWSDPVDDTLVNDVVVGDWSRPWNLKPEKRVKGIPSASLWASDPGGFGQVGCIYTAQGFEYDFNGVIFGPDLVWRNGQWLDQSSESQDGIVKRAENFGELARHTYRVLLTRGLIGCILYSTDSETNDFLARMVKSPGGS